ncbi:MAG: hypothetical protein CL840_18535 [Crocinitomicaceae bacterium]|nr:hypothetical protein [Crocinitomicaceae bacterium]|tara:strand:- start:15539 stop:16183 length:645 start_codon:yes stop_codon:yes gene_type:complete
MGRLLSLVSLLVLLWSCGELHSQHLEVQLGGGVGETYLVEQNEARDVNFNRTAVVFGAIKLMPDSSYFNLKLLFQYVSSRVNGEDWEGKSNTYDFRGLPIGVSTLEGEVSSITSFLVLEHLSQDKKFNLGYDIGIGFTKERLVRSSNNDAEFRSFASFRLGGIASYSFGKRSRISFEPSIYWTDIVNSFRPENYKLAGEDVSLLFNLGYSYRLF